MATSEKIICNKTEILKLIPQQTPMVMVDKLVSCCDGKTVSDFMVDEENIFCENGVFTEPGLIENIAQTAAAGVGYQIFSAHAKDAKIPIGYIGAIKNLKIHFLPPVGQEIQTEVQVEHQVMNATIITGKILSGNKLAVECEMKIFLK
jgi:predicted hotdog family 3-hydroxylacyl-ACP dehydratase